MFPVVHQSPLQYFPVGHDPWKMQQTNRSRELSDDSDEYETICQNSVISEDEEFCIYLLDFPESSDKEFEQFDKPKFGLSNRQKQVVEWMITKEKQEPYGGIIATDMGSVINKITVIKSLLSKSKVPNMVNTQSEGETDLDETVNEMGHTLIVCSKYSICEWTECIQNNNLLNILKICVHYGKHRNMSLFCLCQNDIVITTDTLVQKSFNHKSNDPLSKIKWSRIVLDNTLIARNHKHQYSKALCQLPGICRWAFIGSKLVNDDDKDAYYSLVKYIKYKTLSNPKKWKMWCKINPTVTVKDRLKYIVYSKRII